MRIGLTLAAILFASSAFAQSVQTTGTSTTSTGAVKVTVNQPPNDVSAGPTGFTGTGNLAVNSQGSGSVGVQATGSGSGLTFNFQATVDNSNWFAIPCVNTSTAAIVTSASANGSWTCQSAGYQQVRVNLSAIGGGTETFTVNASAGSEQPPIGTQGTSTNITGVNGAAVDPCMGQNRTNLAISTNATSLTQIIAASGSTKIYICSIILVAPGATAFSLNTGTGTNCGSSTAALIGSTTAANGISLGANSGFTAGGGGSIAVTAASSELCTLQSNAVQVAGNLTYVQQ